MDVVNVIAVQHKASLQVSVPEERDDRRSRHQRFYSVPYGYHIFVFVDRRSVHKWYIRKSFDPHRSLRQRTKPFQIFPGELIMGPLGNPSGNGIEISNVDQAAHRLVVISTDKELSQPARAFNDFIGTCPVADDIAQVKDHVVRGRSREAGIKSFEIAVNIA